MVLYYLHFSASSSSLRYDEDMQEIDCWFFMIQTIRSISDVGVKTKISITVMSGRDFPKLLSRLHT